MTDQDPTISTHSDLGLGKEHICKSCGNKFTGSYCNQCGEKILLPRDRTFKTFVSNIRQAISPRDNKFLRSLLLIVTKPGFLSKEIVEGRRVNYVRPLQLFFALNVVYFLFPLVQLFNTSFDTQMYLRTHSPLVQKMVKHKLVTEGYSLEAYRLLYNEKSTSMAKMLIIVFVLLAALPFTIVYRKRNRYFTDHLTLSVELASFNLLMNALFLSLLVIVINKLIHFTHTGWERYLDDITLTVIFVLTNLYFLFSAGRTFYGQRGFKLIIKVLLGMLGLFITLEAYRLVLFLVTYWVL
jgi:hypothetical protein